jgi:hypothetical protein
VHEAVSTKDQINLWQIVLYEIQMLEANAISSIFHSVSLDELFNNIGACVIRFIEVNVPHPVKIAAWNIQHRGNIESIEQN